MEEAHRRLTGWKAIAAFIGRDARTAKRWEGARGMPVHRVPGGERGMVWADAEEIRRWMLRAVADDQLPALSAVPAPFAAVAPVGPGFGAPDDAGSRDNAAAGPIGRRARWSLAAFALVAALLAILAALPARVAPAASQTGDAYADDADAEALYLRGIFLWNTRTPEGLAEARADFLRLIRTYPQRADAYARLADCYLLMREFGAMPDAQAYRAAERAARSALALDPKSSGALRAMAFVDFWGRGRVGALDAFGRALAADPSSAQTRHWYATALSARGRIAEATRMIEAARRLDPQSAAIVADEAMIQIQADDIAAARSTLADLADLDPRSAAVHRYRAVLALLDRDGASWLREKRTEVSLRGDARFGHMLPALNAAFATGGFEGLARALAATAADDTKRGGCAITAADYAALAGDQASARRWVLHAAAARDPVLVQLPGDVLLRPLRADPALRPLFDSPMGGTA